jgi:hypothetical protein
MARSWSVAPVSSRPKLCTLFCISKGVRAGKRFGFRQWQLLSVGNSVFVALGGGGGSIVCDVIFEGIVRRLWRNVTSGWWGTIWRQNRVMSFMNDPNYLQYGNKVFYHVFKICATCVSRTAAIKYLGLLLGSKLNSPHMSTAFSPSL